VALTELGALRIVDPKAWAKRVLDALREADGNRTHAAAALGITHRQMMRWMQDPLLERAPEPKPGNLTGRPRTKAKRPRMTRKS